MTVPAGISMNHEAHKSCVCQLLRFVCSRIDGLRCATHFYGMQASIEVLMEFSELVSDYHMETKETAITRKTCHINSTPLPPFINSHIQIISEIRISHPTLFNN